MKCKATNPLCQFLDKCCFFCPINKNGCNGCDENFRECADVIPETQDDIDLLEDEDGV